MLGNFFRMVKSIATGGRNLGMIMEDGKYALVLLKRKFIRYILTLLKGFSYYFFLASLAIVVVVLAVGVIFEIYSAFAYGNTEMMSDVNPDQMREWSLGLTDEEIEEFQNYGASIHPRKIYHYAEIEDQSYPKNIEILVPQYIKKWGDGGNSETTEFIVYSYNIGDTSYPYRQWWQSTATLDTISDSANREDDLEIIERAREELKPYFAWSDPQSESYQAGDKYDHTSQREEETIKTVTRKVVTRGDGETSTQIYNTETKTYKPLPFMEAATTMFADVGFEYEQIHESNTTTDTSTRTYQKKKKGHRTNEEGVVEEYDYEVTMTETTTVTTTVEVNSWDLVYESRDYVETYLGFLQNNKIDPKSDPYVILMMAEYLPQNYDFVNQFSEYLTNMEFKFGGMGGYGGVGGSYTGDFGEFPGGDFAFPVVGYQYITSAYGYRTHPTTGQRGTFHQGVDFRAPTGTELVSVVDGTVSFVGWRGNYGNLVIVNHGGGIETYYAHCSRMLVTPGQKVSKGELIALAGATGRTKGAHLHFEVRKNGSYTDPVAWLKGGNIGW